MKAARKGKGKLYVVAAIADELLPLQAMLKHRGGAPSLNLEFCALGVGAINSAIELSRIAPECDKARVLFIGTAGMLGGEFAPGSVYQASVFRWYSLGLAFGEAYLPEGTHPDVPAQIIKSASAGTPLLPVITTPEITSSEVSARALQERCGVGLENLEAYGIARYLNRTGRSLSAFFAVTNAVGEESHSQYLRFRQLAWRRLAETVCALLSEGMLLGTDHAQDSSLSFLKV